MVRKFAPTWNKHVIQDRLYHYKTHFGIILKKSTAFTLIINTTEAIENLYFFCPSELKESSLVIDLANEISSKKIFTTTNDCVPMISVSYNKQLEVQIITANWVSLPVFHTKNITQHSSRVAEEEFFNSVKTYGFVENDYTQMLLSWKDIEGIRSKGDYSLYKGLMNQIDIVKYYNYLIGATRYEEEEDSHSFVLVEKYRLFLRTEKCVGTCDYGAYFSIFWIVCPDGIFEFLESNSAASWGLLHEVAHYYDIKSSVLGFGNTVDVWTNIFAAFYQHKHQVDTYWMKESENDWYSTVEKYQKKIPFAKWEYKEQLHFFMSLFAYDGSDRSFREFNLRYFSSENAGNSNNIISIILEVFLEVHDVNLLPFLKKVLNFEEYRIPLVTPDLEVLLLNGRAVVPVIDFGQNPKEMQQMSQERDLRDYSPLMLMRKLRKKYIQVEIVIKTPIDLTDYCLYLNNHCHMIQAHEMFIDLLMDVYSVYFAEIINNELFISDITYYVVSQKMKIIVNVDKVKKNSLPMLYYHFEAQGIEDLVFLKIFIDYKEMTIAVEQLTNEIHMFFAKELYFRISLVRNGCKIFEYNFYGSAEKQQKKLVNVVHEFEINDEINIYHGEPNRLQMHFPDYVNEAANNTFIFTNVGLRDAHDIIDINKFDIRRINEFNKNYNIDLSYNSYYQILLAHYRYELIANGLRNYVPKDWNT